MTYTYTEFIDKPGRINLLKRWLGYRIRNLGGYIMMKGNDLQLSGKDKHIVDVEFSFGGGVMQIDE